MKEIFPIGTLLIPGEFMVRNMNLTFAVILSTKDDLWGASYRILLTTGIDSWITHETILDLFIVHRM